MSLLEDVFLQDEAGEAQELERVIEGDEYDERLRASSPDSDNNSAKGDEAEEDKRRVDPTESKSKRIIKNPRFILNPARLTGPRGIQIIPEHFKDFKFKGKGKEKEDLDMVLKKLEHWAYRLYPKFQFEDCLKKIETLGKKRPVMVHLHKIRTDQFMSEETVVQQDSSDDEAPAPVPEQDEFDKLLQQQIEKARATPAQKAKQPEFRTPIHEISPLAMPKATSSPSISDEQRERMLRNRRLAEERRLAKLTQTSEEPFEIVQEVNVTQSKNTNIDNDSHASDNEYDFNTVNQSVVADVHDTSKLTENNARISDDDVENAGNTDSINTTKAIDVEKITEIDGHNIDSEIGRSVSHKDLNKHNMDIDLDHDSGQIPDIDVEKSQCVIYESVSKTKNASLVNDIIEIHDNGMIPEREEENIVTSNSIPNVSISEVGNNLADEEIMNIDFNDKF